MAAPNITSPIHASALVDGDAAATAFIGIPINCVSVVRNGVGDYTVNLSSEIDQLDAHYSLTMLENGTARLNRGGVTDSALQVLTFNLAGAAADLDFEFAVMRVRQPG